MSAPLRLRSYEFRKEREATWRRLELLVSRVEKRGLRSLDGEELAELPMLYRGTLSSLSVARAISLDRNLLDYLESLCERAYFCVYQSRKHLRETLADFFARDFPRAVRRFKWHLLIAFLFMAAGTLSGYQMVKHDPETFHSFVASELAGGRGPEASTEDLHAGLYDGSGFRTDELGLFSTQLFVHNAGVSILCFALGFVAGIPVFVLLTMNGLMLGAFAAVYAERGLALDLWGWILPHGVTELLAILLAGAGGLVLAQALIFPGRYDRIESMARRGREAGVLVVGAVLMLLVSGFIEGVFRQRVHDIGLRYTVAIGTALFWIAYFAFCGRRDRP